MLILVKLFLKVYWLAALSSEQSRIIFIYFLSFCYNEVYW